MTGNSGPGYKQHPGHTIELAHPPKRVTVTFAGETVAASGDAIMLEETGHAPVYYLPRRDVRMDLLRRTDQHTFCPFKGEASYFTLAVGDRVAENAVWSYEKPYDEVTDIKDHVAFYLDRVEAITAE